MNANSVSTDNPDISPDRVLFSADDALRLPPTLEWCVQGLLAQPSLNMLVGDPGAKKTLLVMDLAVCVALGKPWLGFSVCQSPVLFIDEQTGPHQLWSRFNSALKAHGSGPGVPLHYISLAGHGLRDKQAAETLIDRARNLGAHLIILDAFTNLLRGGGESTLGAVQPVLHNLRCTAELCHAAVLVTHQANRRGSARGTTAISAALDLLLSIESDPAETVVKITAQKGRLKVPDPFDARANFETAADGSLTTFFSRYEPRSFATDRFPYPYGTLEYQILNELDLRSQASFFELQIHNISYAQRKIRNTLQKLMDEKLVVRADGGKQGKEAVYVLAKNSEMS